MSDITKEQIRRYAETKNQLKTLGRRFVKQQINDSFMFDGVELSDNGEEVTVLYWIPQCGVEGTTVSIEKFLNTTESS